MGSMGWVGMRDLWVGVGVDQGAMDKVTRLGIGCLRWLCVLCISVDEFVVCS